jgi:hypothetical protein
MLSVVLCSLSIALGVTSEPSHALRGSSLTLLDTSMCLYVCSPPGAEVPKRTIKLPPRLLQRQRLAKRRRLANSFVCVACRAFSLCIVHILSLFTSSVMFQPVRLCIPGHDVVVRLCVLRVFGPPLSLFCSSNLLLPHSPCQCVITDHYSMFVPLYACVDTFSCFC